MEAGVVGVREGYRAGRASVTTSELSAGRRGGARRGGTKRKLRVGGVSGNFGDCS